MCVRVGHLAYAATSGPVRWERRLAKSRRWVLVAHAARSRFWVAPVGTRSGRFRVRLSDARIAVDDRIFTAPYITLLDPDQAVAEVEWALAAGARSPQVYLERGLARADAGKVAEALEDFRQASIRNPVDPVPIENAARAAHQIGRFREAAQTYEKLLKLQPSRGDLWKTLGAVYLYDLDEPQSALPAFQRALGLEKDPAEREKLLAVIDELSG